MLYLSWMRRDFLGSVAALAAALWALACGREEASTPLVPEFAPGKGGGGGGPTFEDQNASQREEDYAEHGAGLYCYKLNKHGKYTSLTFGRPPPDGTKMQLPEPGEYEVWIPDPYWETL